MSTPATLLQQQFRSHTTVADTKLIQDFALFLKLQSHAVLLYFLKSAYTPRRLATILNRNTAANVHTLFVVDEPLVFPNSPADSACLAMLYNLNSSKIFAYKVIDDTVFILPTYFYWQSDARHHQFGLPVDLSSLKCYSIERVIRGEKTAWGVVGFETRQFQQRHHYQERFSFHGNYRRRISPNQKVLDRYYSVLGVDTSASLEEIRHAYRQLARLYHPDTNTSPIAKTRMQAINEAYKHLTKQYK